MIKKKRMNPFFITRRWSLAVPWSNISNGVYYSQDAIVEIISGSIKCDRLLMNSTVIHDVIKLKPD